MVDVVWVRCDHALQVRIDFCMSFDLGSADSYFIQARCSGRSEGVVTRKAVAIVEMYLGDGTLGDQVQNVRTCAPEAHDCDPLAGKASVDRADSRAPACSVGIFKRPVIAIDDACAKSLRSYVWIELFRLCVDVLYVVLNLREVIGIGFSRWAF